MQLLDTLIPAGRDIQRLWHEKAAGGQMPARADFSIDELKPWLGRLILADILPGFDLFYRVHGTKLAEMLGQELTGKRLSDLQPPELRERIRADYAELVAVRRPLVFRRRRSYGERGSFLVERILLPLSHAGETVDQVLSLVGWIASSHEPENVAPVRVRDVQQLKRDET